MTYGGLYVYSQQEFPDELKRNKNNTSGKYFHYFNPFDRSFDRRFSIVFSLQVNSPTSVSEKLIIMPNPARDLVVNILVLSC